MVAGDVTKEIPCGYCHCGCGGETSIIKSNDITRGRIKGEPFRFLPGHSLNQTKRPCSGYLARRPNGGGLVREHRAAAQEIIGGELPPGAIVHHINGNRQDNRPENLFICKDHSEHFKIHRQEIALQECGHADWRKCRYCHQYDSPENLVSTGSRGMQHKSCHNQRNRERRANVKAHGATERA